MNSAGRTIAKNAGALTAAQVVNWSLGLILTVILSRFLGPTAVGKFYLGVSIWAILCLLISLGTDMLLTKEIARSPAKSGSILGTAIALRVIFFALSIGLLTVYLFLVGYPNDTVLVLYILGATNLLGQVTSACQAVVQAFEKMEYIALGSVANKVVLTLMTVVVLLLGYGLMAVVAVATVGMAVNLLILVIALRNLDTLHLSFDWTRAMWLIRAGIPYLATTAFLVFYLQADVVVLSLLADEQTVGWYSAADRLYGALMFVPGILMQALFPFLSRTYQDSSDSSSRAVRRGIHWLLLLGVPMGIGLVVVSDSLVQLIYGPDFLQSGAVLAIFGVVLTFMYLTTLLGWSMVAMDRQAQWAIVMAVATAATIPLDLLLIPWCQGSFGNGAIGGALAYIVTEIGMTIAGIRLLPKGILNRSDAFFALRVVVAGLLMGVISWWWKDSFIAIPIAIGAVAYFALTLMLRAVPDEERAMMRWIGQLMVRTVRIRISGSEV